MTDNIQTTTKSKGGYKGWIIFIVIVLGLTLPFHYVPSAMKVFPKDHFTFKHTIITEDDINDIVRRYNNCKTIFEQQTFNNDPFVRTLREHGLIVDKDRKDIFDDTDK